MIAERIRSVAEKAAENKEVISSWAVTASASLVTHLTEIKLSAEIAAWLLTAMFTLWQWHRKARE